jgi:hypothetical protein
MWDYTVLVAKVYDDVLEEAPFTYGTLVCAVKESEDDLGLGWPKCTLDASLGGFADRSYPAPAFQIAVGLP